MLLCVLGCHHPTEQTSQKEALQESELSGMTFKETSRDPKQKNDEKQSQRIIFSFNDTADVVEFALSCILKKRRDHPQEVYSDRSIGIILQDKVPHQSRMAFQIPRDFNITLKVAESFTYYNEKNEDDTDICTETLKTGNYQFYPESKGLFEVQVNGNFYMYMQKQ